jgi:Spy/CpxP family protein refolding chaperone
MATAFKSAAFDTSAIKPNEKVKLPECVNRIVQMLGIILPVLTAEQRTALSSLIKDKVSQPESDKAAPIPEQTCAQLAKTLLAGCSAANGPAAGQSQSSSGCKQKAGACKRHAGGCKQHAGGCKAEGRQGYEQVEQIERLR